jgi:metastasis-associated protein MTA
MSIANGDIDSDDEDAIAERAEQQNMRTREVFLSRQIETLPATLIRGKCSVTLLSEVETAPSYLKREDAFFYSLVYDPQQKTLQADRGEIRIGSTYQAQVQSLLQEGETDGRGHGVKNGSGK